MAFSVPSLVDPSPSGRFELGTKKQNVVNSGSFHRNQNGGLLGCIVIRHL